MSGVKHPATREPVAERNQSLSAPGPTGEIDVVTIGEVTIKLDLARQFLDMGDPESARLMLDEVLDEGDSFQKRDARRLIDSLP